MNWKALGADGWESDDGAFRVKRDGVAKDKWHIEQNKDGKWIALAPVEKYPSPEDALSRAKEMVELLS